MKKPKHLLFLSLLILGFASVVHAQDNTSKIDLKLYGGYGLLTPGSDYFTSETAAGGNTFDYTKVKYGYGSGVHFGAGVAYRFNDIISFGIDADYLTKSKTSPNNNPADTLMGTIRSNQSVFSLIPNVSFKLWSNAKWKMYNNVGVIAAVHTNISTTAISVYNLSAGTTTNTQVNTYKYGVNPGFRDNLGMQFHVAKHISLFAEISYYDLNVKPSQLTGVFTNVQDKNGTIISSPPSLSIIYYKNSGTDNHTINETTNTASDNQPAITQHILSIGLNAGVTLTL